jgi:ATP-dependent DNA ligase
MCSLLQRIGSDFNRCDSARRRGTIALRSAGWETSRRGSSGRRRIATPAVPSYSVLPEPMLARSGRLPTSGDYAYEVKWDGFRAIVSTDEPLRLRSRRGWDMTPHVGFLPHLPVRGVFDGELVALDNDGRSAH